MKIKNLLTSLFAGLLLLQISCNRNEEIEIIQPKGVYENGFFASNEGNFGVPNAGVSYISKDLNQIDNAIYPANNAGENLGDVLQTIGFSGDNAYLVLNNSNKIIVANRYTMKKKTEFSSQLTSPRYIAFTSSFSYVTNDTYGGEKYVSIYNLNDNTFVKKIAMPDAAERIVEAGGTIFVQNASFGFGNKISVIDAVTNTLKPQITLPNGQINKIISSNSAVYAITAGSIDSYIYQISPTGSIVKTITLPGIAEGNNLEILNDKFYFTSGNKIYTMAVNSTTPPTLPLITVPANPYSALYGFSVLDDKIFTSDANGFSAGSTISVYSTTGTLIKTLTGGRATNGFYAN